MAIEQNRASSVVCVCIIFNHAPWPGHIEFLREIYRDRFSLVRFIVPMERYSDDDVITVYRGSYSHNAYFTEALTRLQPLECSHYLLIHDDVLLSPAITSGNLLEVLGVSGDEGYIPFIAPTPSNIGDWGHWVGPLWRLTSPRNFLSGTGADSLEALLAQLPPRKVAAEKLGAYGAPPETTITLTADSLDRGGLRKFSNFGDPREEVNVRFMTEYLRSLFRTEEETGEITVPYPFVYAGFGGDFVLAPKAHAEAFAHCSGVLAMGGVFAEVAHPTALLLACDKVQVAPNPFQDFLWTPQLQTFPEIIDRMLADPHLIAAHPLKLSTVADKAAMVARVRSLAEAPILPASSSSASTEERLRRRVLAVEPAFDAQAYLDANPDVAQAGMSPYVHYLEHGRHEGRRLTRAPAPA